MTGQQFNGETSALEVEKLESALARIPSVTAARIVTGPNSRIAEVHLLARRDRAAKQLVRDVQSVALTNFGIEVDYRTVSVVQLDEPQVANDSISNSPRIALRRLLTETSGPATVVNVEVQSGVEQLSGIARGPTSSDLRLVARAVVDAVSPLIKDSAIEVDFAEVLRAGSYDIALVVLRLAVVRQDQVVSGSAVVRNDTKDAMARASLAGLNRLISA